MTCGSNTAFFNGLLKIVLHLQYQLIIKGL